MNDEPREVSRGWFLPVALTDLYEDQIINGEDLALLGKINSLCHKKEGCWATNTYLAKWWHREPNWVSRCLSRYVDLGLITITKEGNRRTIWSNFQPNLPYKKTTRGVVENYKAILV